MTLILGIFGEAFDPNNLKLMENYFFFSKLYYLFHQMSTTNPESTNADLFFLKSSNSTRNWIYLISFQIAKVNKDIQKS